MRNFDTSFALALVIALLFSFPFNGAAKVILIEVVGELSIDTTELETFDSALTQGQLSSFPQSSGVTELDFLLGHHVSTTVETPKAKKMERTLEKLGLLELDTTPQQQSGKLSEGYAQKDVSLEHTSDLDDQDNYLTNLAGFGSQLQILTANVHSETKTVLTNFPLDTTNDLLGNGLSNGFSKTQLRFSSEVSNPSSSANDYVEFLLESPVERVKPINTLTSLEKIIKFPLDSTSDDDQNGLTDGLDLASINLQYHKHSGVSQHLDDYLVILDVFPHDNYQPFNTTQVNAIFSQLKLDTTKNSELSGLSEGFEKTRLVMSDFDHSIVKFADDDFFYLLHTVTTDPLVLKQLELSKLFVSQFTLDTTQDSDGDGLTDGFENRFVALDFSLIDSDGDGLSDHLNLIGELHTPVGKVSSSIETFKIDSISTNALILSVKGQFQTGDTVHVLQTSNFLEWRTVFSATSTADGSAEYSFAVPTTDVQGFFRIVLVE